MLRLLTITIITGLLLPSFMTLRLVAEYSINKKTIASTLCENIKRPKTRCEGKCYMMKRLAAQEKKNKPAQADKTIKLQVLIGQEEKTCLQPHCLDSFEKLPQQFSNQLPKFIKPVFHPPCLAEVLFS